MDELCYRLLGNAFVCAYSAHTGRMFRCLVSALCGRDQGGKVEVYVWSPSGPGYGSLFGLFLGQVISRQVNVCFAGPRVCPAMPIIRWQSGTLNFTGTGFPPLLPACFALKQLLERTDVWITGGWGAQYSWELWDRTAWHGGEALEPHTSRV